MRHGVEAVCTSGGEVLAAGFRETVGGGPGGVGAEVAEEGAGGVAAETVGLAVGLLVLGLQFGAGAGVDFIVLCCNSLAILDCGPLGRRKTHQVSAAPVRFNAQHMESIPAIAMQGCISDVAGVFPSVAQHFVAFASLANASIIGSNSIFVLLFSA